MPRIASAYTPRRPHDTALHRFVREHHATFVAHAEATHAAPLPRYASSPELAIPRWRSGSAGARVAAARPQGRWRPELLMFEHRYQCARAADLRGDGERINRSGGVNPVCGPLL